MKVHEIKFTKGRTDSWWCYITFTFTSDQQFTDVQETVVAGAKYWLWAYVRAKRNMVKFYNAYKAKPGERERKGWN